MAEVQIRGPLYGTTGTPTPLTAGVSGAQRVTLAHGDYFDTVSRGNVWVVANQTGVTTQAGLSATTPVLTLYNPKGNNKNGVLIYAGCIAPVAFAAAAAIWLAVNNNPSAAAVTGTAAVPVNALIGNGASPSISAFLAATLPAAPTAIATLGVGLTGAITTVPALATLGRYFDGEIVIGPGAALSFQTSTASGTNGLLGEFVWEEVPILS